MELSENTIGILKNYAAINSNIVIKPGNNISTISEAKNILASVDLPEEFTQEIGVYDLNEFLGVLGLVDKPRLKFNDDHVVIGDSSEADVKFHLDNDTLNKIKRAASALGHKELSITPGGDNCVTLTVTSSDNSTANTFSIDVTGESKTDKYNFIFNISNLKMIAGNYDVDISSKLLDCTRKKFKIRRIKYGYGP